uniref:Uncharacterized protein n=2 Tax=Zea mays TaxID=4577 RepID=B4FVZ1_MAIZE|nr:unknown [Zea mays]
MPTQNDSVLKVSSDVSVHVREEGTSVTENRAESLNTVAKDVETRLSQAIAEKAKAEKLIEELEKASPLSKAEVRETISEDERYMLRKVGLKMKQFLLLGGHSPQPFPERFCSKDNHFVLENRNLLPPLCT